MNLPRWQVKPKQGKQQQVNKIRSNRTGSTRRQELFLSSSFLGEYVSLEGCEFQTQDATNGLTLVSDESSPKARFTFHYRNPSRRNLEPLQQAWGTTHKRVGGSQVPTIFHTKVAAKFSTTRCLGFPSGNPRLESLKRMRGKWRTAWWSCRSGASPSILRRSASLGGGIGRSEFLVSLQQWSLLIWAS